jgi:hypothetical protein
MHIIQPRSLSSATHALPGKYCTKKTLEITEGKEVEKYFTFYLGGGGGGGYQSRYRFL